MTDPRIRSVAVHWGRLLGSVAVLLAALFALFSWPAGARALDHDAVALLVPVFLLAVPLGVGRPWAEVGLDAAGIRSREGRFFRWLPRTVEIGWDEVSAAETREELDGSRSLTVRARSGREIRVWETYSEGTAFDAVERHVRDALRGRGVEVGAGARVVRTSVWNGSAARVAVAMAAAGWLGLVGWLALHPPENRAWMTLRLAWMAALLAPLVGLALRRRGET